MISIEYYIAVLLWSVEMLMISIEYYISVMEC